MGACGWGTGVDEGWKIYGTNLGKVVDFSGLSCYSVSQEIREGGSQYDEHQVLFLFYEGLPADVRSD